MNPSWQPTDELADLVEAICHDDLLPEQAGRLEELVLSDPRAREYYVRYLHMHASLPSVLRGRKEGTENGGRWAAVDSFSRDSQGGAPAGVPLLPPIVTDGQSGDWRSDDSFNRDPAASAPTGGLSQFSSDENGTVPFPPSENGTVPLMPDATPSPYLGFLGSAYNGVTGYFSTHDVARALLIVTLIFAPIVGFAVYALLQPDQQVAKAPKPEPLGPALFPHEGARAGAITGTLDCVWKDSQLRFPESDVCVGDVFRIDAGLMEITYDSGAKVILQAPTNYTVTSKTGGYLDIGRLTAKMGVKPKAWQKSRFGVPDAGNEELGANNEERRTNKEERPAPTSSLLLPTSSFVVNTPTATVTDIGTEFGVHVDNHGATESLVFVGTVKVQTPAAEGEKPAREETLYATDSVRVEQKVAGDNTTYKVQRGVVKSAGFVRVLRRAAKPEPIAEAPVDDEKQHRFASGAIFEQSPPGRYHNSDGAAVYDYGEELRQRQEKGSSRGYLRTAETDYCDRDFVFEGTFHVSLGAPDRLTGSHYIYIGIGDGVPNRGFYDMVTCGLAIGWQVDTGRVAIKLCRPDSTRAHATDASVAESPPGSLTSGWHRFRITKVGQTVRFAIGPEKPNSYEKEFESPPFDLPAVAPLLNGSNSRLFAGTGNGENMSVRFENFSITAKTAEKQAVGKPADGGPNEDAEPPSGNPTTE